MKSAASENPVNFAKPCVMCPLRVCEVRSEGVQGGCHWGRRPDSNPYKRPTSATAEEIASDDHALDLVGALVDLRDLGIPHEALHRVLARVAVAAEDLDRVSGNAHGGVAGVTLGHR